MLLNLSDLSDEPLHAQISRQVRAKILSHDLPGGEPLPSIRALAREARVSVITVQRAYEDLEREGLIHSRRGKGFWVAELPEREREVLAQERFTTALAELVRHAAAEGLTPDDIRHALERLLEENG